MGGHHSNSALGAIQRFEQDFHRGVSLLFHVLMNGGEGRVVIGRGCHVIVTGNGAISGHLFAVFQKSTNGSEGRQVIMRNKSGETLTGLQELLGQLVAALMARIAQIEFRDQRLVKRKTNFAGKCFNPLPSLTAVNERARSSNEGYSPMTEIVEVFDDGAAPRSLSPVTELTRFCSNLRPIMTMGRNVALAVRAVLPRGTLRFRARSHLPPAVPAAS